MRYFNNVDPSNATNPMKYWCAPNQYTYDYGAAHNFTDFISAMFFHCYVAPEDTSMQYDEETLYWVREDFLDCLEVALLTFTPDDELLWEAVIHDQSYLPYDRIDGGVWVEPKEGNRDQDGCHVIWRFKGTEPTSTDEELDVLRFDFCWDLCIADDQVYWLGSDAIESLDTGNIQSIIHEAREINQKAREAVQ